MVPDIYGLANTNIRSDPARIAAQIVSGIGFLGAGAIIKMGFDTKGLTTAATIWTTAAIGMCIGAGLYFAGIITTVLVLVSLIVLGRLENKYTKTSHYFTINIETQKKLIEDEKLYKEILTLPLDIISKNVEEEGKIMRFEFITKIPKNISIFDIKNKIKKFTHIQKVSIVEHSKG